MSIIDLQQKIDKCETELHSLRKQLANYDTHKAKLDDDVEKFLSKHKKQLLSLGTIARASLAIYPNFNIYATFDAVYIISDEYWEIDRIYIHHTDTKKKLTAVEEQLLSYINSEDIYTIEDQIRDDYIQDKISPIKDLVEQLTIEVANRFKIKEDEALEAVENYFETIVSI